MQLVQLEIYQYSVTFNLIKVKEYFTDFYYLYKTKTLSIHLNPFLHLDYFCWIIFVYEILSFKIVCKLPVFRNITVLQYCTNITSYIFSENSVLYAWPKTHFTVFFMYFGMRNVFKYIYFSLGIIYFFAL